MAAFDTMEKRASAMNYVAFGYTVLPMADTVIDAGDRAHCCWLYYGLFVAAPPAPRRQAAPRHVRRGWPPKNPFVRMALEQRSRPVYPDVVRREHEDQRGDDGA